VDAARIAALRAEGLSWAKIAERLDIGEGTAIRAAQRAAKIPSETTPATPLLSAAD